MTRIPAPVLVVALAAVTLAVALVRSGLRRRARRASPLSLPAGLKHMASSLSALPGARILLPSPRRAPGSRRRLGALLGLR